MADEYPWAEFLKIRRQLIVYFWEVEGKSLEEIAHILSCDPIQVKLIYDSAAREKKT